MADEHSTSRDLNMESSEENQEVVASNKGSAFKRVF